MKHDLPSLESLKVFEAAARHLSFIRAADELCISKGAVSYQINKLETQVGQALFKRSVRQIYLTENGQALYITTGQVFNQLRKQLTQISEDNANTVVTVAVSTYVAVRWLSRKLIGFNEKHPQINVLLQHSVNDENFNLQDVDLALRWSDDKSCLQDECVASAPIDMYPVCSPLLLKKHGITETSDLDEQRFEQSPLAQTQLLAEEHNQDCWQQWFDIAATELNNPRSLIKDSNVRVQSAIDGQGWMLADQLMQNELNNQLLIAPFHKVLKGYNYALLSHPKRHLSSNAEKLKQWLVAQLANPF